MPAILLFPGFPSSGKRVSLIAVNDGQKHTVDQTLTFTSGKGKATIAGKDQDVKAGDLIVVPAGTQHQFINTGPTPL